MVVKGIDKPVSAELVVGSVTTSESLVLYVLPSYLNGFQLSPRPYLHDGQLTILTNPRRSIRSEHPVGSNPRDPITRLEPHVLYPGANIEIA